MNSVRAIQQLNKRELESGITPEGSWHTDYRDTAFIYVGGLAFELSEGDIIAVFSQYGEPVWIKLARDKETGKSRGFAWIKYEDQRSCDLAVDNLGGTTILDRVIRVDHARYKPHDDEDMRDNTMGDELPPPGHDDAPTEDDSDDDRPMLPEEIELGRLQDTLDEDDPMRDSMIKAQQEKVDDAVRRLKRRMRKDKDKERRRHRDRDHDRKRIKSADDNDDDDRRRHRDRHSKSSRRHSSRDRNRSDRRTSEDRDRRHRHASRDEDSSRRRRRHSSEGSASSSERRSREKPATLPSRARSPV